MIRHIARRVVVGAGLVLAVVSLTFLLIDAAPGDPARLWLPPGAGEAELDAARRALGLDRPLWERYVAWLSDFVRGDWGTSLARQRPVASVVMDALPHTLVLTGMSLIVTYVGGIALGLVQAIRRRTVLDSGLTAATLYIVGMPSYWFATILVLVFAYGAARYGWPDWLRFPALGVSALDAEFLSPWGRIMDRLRHLALPLTTLGLLGIAGTARFVRGSVLDVRQREFARTARAKGLPAFAIETRHVLRNALLPVITLLGLSLPALFSGTVFVEVIFAWPGMGREMVSAVSSRDYPVVLATTAIFGTLVIAGNLLADLLYTVADPRLKERQA
jgi:peptide/nickel transport system permease protein